MKNNKLIRYACIGALGLSMLSSCSDIMDTEPFTSYSEELVWSTKATADAFVIGTYSSVLGLGDYTGNASYSVCTPYGNYDNLESASGFPRETYTVSSDYGISRFSTLRRCNLIIQNAAQSTGLSEEEKTQLAAEGHCLRGMVFLSQAQWLGRFIPATEVYSYPEDTVKFLQMDLTANPTESYKYVMDDFDEAVKGLPETSDAGRLNVYAAHILRSRAALQAYAYTKDATYLDKALESCNAVINSGKYSLENTENGFKNMFLADGAYSSSEIILAYYRLANNTTCQNISEIQITVPNIPNDNLAQTGATDRFNYSGGVQMFECWAQYFPTQDLVDQFLVTDAETGEAKNWWETSQFKNNTTELDPSTCQEGSLGVNLVDQNGASVERKMPTAQETAAQLTWSNGKTSSCITRYTQLNDGATKNISELMYENRDARFYGTVVYDGSEWMGEKISTKFGGNAWSGCRDGNVSSWYTTNSNYYWRKGVYEVSPRPYVSNKTDYHYVVCRLAEAYLNAAEAYLYKGDVSNAVKMLNVTRTTQGKLAASTATSAAEAWKDYKRERICEFAFESGSSLYFSMLRWGLANSANGSWNENDGYVNADVIEELETPVSKIYISNDRTKMAVGYITFSEQYKRQFTPEHRYVMPIPQSFIDNRAAFGIATKQNPGWR